MENLLKEIQKEAKKNEPKLEEVYKNLKSLGIQMFITNTMSKEQVISFCGGLIRLYLGLKPKE